MSTSETNDPQAYASLTEDELYAAIAADLVGRQALPMTAIELAERGRRWFAAQRDVLKQRVCASTEVKAFVDDKSENVTLVVETAKLLAGLLLPVNPVIVAALLVRRGLRSFCADRWEET
jgi:hypothetical protein